MYEYVCVMPERCIVLPVHHCCCAAVRNLIRWRVNLMSICNATLLQYDECCSLMRDERRACSHNVIPCTSVCLHVCVQYFFASALFRCNLLPNLKVCVCVHVSFLFILAPGHYSI